MNRTQMSQQISKPPMKRRPKKMMRGGSVTGFKKGGCVIGNRGVRNTKRV